MKISRFSLLALALAGVTAAHAGKTLDTIKQRDQISIGISSGVPGFSAADSKGQWSGLDVDVGKAIAAALLGGILLKQFHPRPWAWPRQLGTASSLLTMATCGAPNMVKFCAACRAEASRSPLAMPSAS